jgi:hypothetical protein
MKTLLPDAPRILAVDASDNDRKRGRTLIRVALHVACWVPFITTAADSWRGPWRAVGDNAHLALVSWSTLSGSLPLIGQPNELPGAPHDLGPLQYWLLTVPVHADTARGVLWGAVLLALVAVSLTVEAGYSVLGETGGLLATGVVVATVWWFPGFANRPEDNPNFGLIFFIAALAACLAVLAGNRKWWPVLVVTASIAAQAHLTYAAASVGLVLIAVVTGLTDQVRAKGGYAWLIVGLLVGAECWIAPFDQQLVSPAGQGNMSLLLHAESEGQPVGLAFALRAVASLAAPSSLWWQQNISQRHDLYQMLASKPAALGLAALAIIVASLVMAVCWLGSRRLAGLAAISLLVCVTATVTFALIPVRGLAAQQHDLIFILFAAVLLAWLTVICVTVVAVRELISYRRDRAGAAAATGWRVSVRAATALLLVAIVALGAVRQVKHYAGAGTNSLDVGIALAKIERSWPRQRPIALGVSAPGAGRFQVLEGLCWALTADGYHADTYHPGNSLNRHGGTLTGVAVVIRGHRMKLTTVSVNPKIRGKWSSCTGHFNDPN